MCSTVGVRAPSGQVMATTSKRAEYSSRPCDFEIRQCGLRHALLVRRSSMASAGVPASSDVRVFTSTKTTVRPSTAMMSSSPTRRVDVPADDVVAEPLEIAGREVFAALAERFCGKSLGSQVEVHGQRH